MRKLLILAALAVATAVSAQVLTVGSIEKLNTSAAQSDARVAAFSPDGTYLLLTSRNQQGLVKFDLPTGSATRLTDALAAGYNPTISTDARRITYRESVMGADHRIISRILCRDLQTRQVRMVQARATGTPVTEDNETAVSVTQDLKVSVSAGGRTYTLAPQGEQYSYIWATLSPDGTKISYFCSEIGGFVCDLQGRVICSLGDRCHAAKWYDNETLVGMEYHSDGQRTTASSITACTLDGRFQRLTDARIIALYPQVSAGKIAFSTPEGEVYMLNVTK